MFYQGTVSLQISINHGVNEYFPKVLTLGQKEQGKD